jgi:two-component system NarL family response regulator
VRLLLVEDDHAYQLAMAAHLQQLAAVDRVHVSGDGEQALELLQSELIDLVLLDLVLPGMGGLVTCRHITSSSAVPVLILTSQDTPQWVQQIWKAGARGYLHKELGFQQVEMALASLMAGASWWDYKATAALQQASGSLAAPRPEQTRKLESLTSREREVLACIAEGDDNRTIAQRLGIGEGTVRSHVHVLLQKLQVSNRTQAALLWLDQVPEKAKQSQVIDSLRPGKCPPYS